MAVFRNIPLPDFFRYTEKLILKPNSRNVSSKMRRVFNLTFKNSRGVFQLPLEIQRTFDDRPSFKTGYDGRPAYWIKVTSVDDDLQRISEIAEIDHIIHPSEIQSLYRKDDGEYVIIDKSVLKNIFPSTDEMLVLQTVPKSAIAFSSLDGSHYFLNLARDKKKKVDASKSSLYNLVWQGLAEKSECLVVQYYAMNNRKYAVVYPRSDGLCMSGLIGDNMKRKRNEAVEAEEVNMILYERLVQEYRAKKVQKVNDDYVDRLKEMIEAALTGKSIKKLKKPRENVPSGLEALMDPEDE